MSKYIAIIDLPDDSKCFGCDKLNIEFSYCRMTSLDIQKEFRRPTDCPLIPVDRVIERLYGLCQSQGDAGYRAVGIVQDELGVTE